MRVAAQPSRRHFVTLSPCHLVTLSTAALLLLPDLAFAASNFPRGPGFYFNIFRLIVVVAIYLGWMRLCWWVDADADEVGVQPRPWNAGLLVGGAVGLLFAWTVPAFALSFLVLLLC